MIGFICIVGLLFCTSQLQADEPITKAPFSYIIDYQVGQSTDKEFRKHFDLDAPALYHPGSDLRLLGRYGFGSMVTANRTDDFEKFMAEAKDYSAFLRRKGVRWITPYFCNQTISGNDTTRLGVWHVYDNWEKFQALGLGPKPAEPLTWMQREPDGRIRYNYKRRCFLERGHSTEQIRYAPCPNNPHWRRICENEARLLAKTGHNGAFIDNCIIHCYCQSCERKFQEYLKSKYTPDELDQAFETRDYNKITLYKEGDHRYWARSFPDFIPWLENKYSPEERRIHFDTTGPLDPKHVDNAGGGMLVGETAEFLIEKVLPPGSDLAFETIRLANPALQTRIGRLRWAETMMFWAWSIGDMLKAMQAAGREIDPEFFLMPNWGPMQRIVGTAGRAEDGHDMKRWKPGGAWQMYEEDMATGIIAPGVVLDYDFQLRFALANGVRGMLLPYTLSGRDISDVGYAEIAGSGGSIFITQHQYLDIRAKYARFFEKYKHLYEGFHSAAEVGLAHFFDQFYYYNIDHSRAVRALNRYLADQQIPFDHLIEEDFKPERLLKYKVIILPNIVYMSPAEISAVKEYLKNGGTVVAIGENGTHDRYCRTQKSSADFFSDSNKVKGLICFDNLSEVLPHRGIYLEPGIQASRGGKFIQAFSDDRLARYEYLAELDRILRFKRYQIPGPLTAIIENSLARNPNLIDPAEGSGIRTTIYRKKQKHGQQLVIHLANKNIPLAVDESQRKLQPVHELKIDIPINDKQIVETIRLYDPDRMDQCPILMENVSPKNGYVRVTLPLLRAYALLEIVIK